MLTGGDIVTVVDREDRFWNRQGRIIGFFDDGDSEGNIAVQFGPEDDDIISIIDRDERTFRFFELQLKREEDWGPQTLARRLFGRNFFRLMLLAERHPVCMMKGCDEKTSRWILVNFIGSVYQLGVCEKHANEYHGLCTEGLSIK